MAQTSVAIHHDPLTRESVVRRTIRSFIRPDVTCDWCGMARPSGHLFQYGTAHDDRPGQIDWHKGTFCAKSCHDAFHS